MIKALYRKVFRSKNRTNALLVAMGAGSGQLLTLLLSPVLARLYSPEDFGAFAIYAGGVGMLAIVCSLRYEYALPIAQDNREVRHLASAVFVLTCSISALTAGVVYGVGEHLLEPFELEYLKGVFWVIPIGILFFASFQVLLYCALRAEAFVTVAWSRAVQGGMVGVAQTSLGLLGLGSVGLAAGHAVAVLLGIAILLPYMLKRYSGLADLSGSRSTLHKYRRFAFFSAPAAVVNTTTVRLPSILFTLLAGASVGGAFVFCQSLLSAPVMLFGRSIGQIYFSQLAVRIRDKDPEVHRFFLSVVRSMAAIAIVPTVLLIVLGPWIFEFLFGTKWALAGAMSRYLALVFFAELIVIPVTQTLEALQKQNLQLWWDSGRLFVVTMTLVGGMYAGVSDLRVVQLYVAVMLICYVVLLVLMHSRLRQWSRGAICRA